MKKITLLTAFAVALLMFACSEEEPLVQKEQVQFTLRIPSSENPGGRSAAHLPSGVKILISLSNASGTVLTRHPVSILKLGDSYITEPIQLNTGQYSIIDFLIVNNDDKILFATPKQGSPLATAVSHSLPYTLTVEKGKISTFEIEVIDAVKNNPDAFGYASFNLKVIDTLPISVFIATRMGQSENLEFTDAKASLYSNGILVGEFALGAKVNYIPLDGQQDGSYKLVVKKENFIDFVKTFSYKELMEGIDQGSIKVVLVSKDDAFTITPPNSLGVFDFSLQFSEAGTIYVNWGDGTIETVNFDSEDWLPSANLSHEYESYENIISITGDLHKIRLFENHAVYAAGVDVSQLTGLEMLTLRGFSASSSVLDLTENLKLEYLTLEGSDFKDVALPNYSVLQVVRLEGCNIENIDVRSNAESFGLYIGTSEISNLSISTGSLYTVELSGSMSTKTTDGITNALYDNASTEEVYNVTFDTSRLNEELSEQSTNKIIFLENAYSWHWIN
ncbi:hypothetical protein [Chryseosolibacter indicus]|uniref:DUF4382 domain-containing protein n=1 Tax=Chryseosolibacter indicus TaxID=2782351 RepID=A0ABS5VVY2_9BACT|nr:hypothetical protein [Chryseosolibacter indicus]MBT1705587.1 hypothetical protein [Chryseosolibacter indicus]